MQLSYFFLHFLVYLTRLLAVLQVKGERFVSAIRALYELLRVYTSFCVLLFS